MTTTFVSINTDTFNDRSEDLFMAGFTVGDRVEIAEKFWTQTGDEHGGTVVKKGSAYLHIMMRVSGKIKQITPDIDNVQIVPPEDIQSGIKHAIHRSRVWSGRPENLGIVNTLRNR